MSPLADDSERHVGPQTRDARSKGAETLGAPTQGLGNNHAVALRQFRSRPQIGQVGRSRLRTP